MRGKAAKAIRRAVYGAGTDKDEKMQKKDLRVDSHGAVRDVGARAIYQRSKARFKSFSNTDLERMRREAIKKAKLQQESIQVSAGVEETAQ